MKERNNAFAGCHPIVNFAFYLFIIVFTIFLNHPVYIAVTFLFALIFAFLLKGKNLLFFLLLFALPVFLLTSILNPIFNHYGTVIENFYIFKNPVTVEALMYGIVSGTMLVTVLLWFQTYNEVVSSDKFIYLFGRIIPKLALIISMTLRLIPKMRVQLKAIANAQNMIGKGMKGGNPIRKIKHGIRILSILITWCLENGIETADSMRARGYGLRHRTSFTLYRFYKRDKFILSGTLCLASVCITGMIFRLTAFNYRLIELNFLAPWSVFNYIVLASFILVCSIPIILEIYERCKWRSLISKI